jgi:branched-chain amino acid transport system permease protein
MTPAPRARLRLLHRWGQVLALVVLLVLAGRIVATAASGTYPPSIWGFQVANGLTIGSVYALVALGYTLVYGILLMINFAHGEILMLGAFGGYFALLGLERTGLLAANPLVAVLIALAVGMLTSTIAGVLLERVAYRPLRGGPRLVALISAIGASIFLQNAVLLAFGAEIKVYPRLAMFSGGWPVGEVFISRLGVIIFVASLVLMAGLYVFVHRSKTGRAMRAVAEDAEAAALMGVDVNRVIVATFAVGSLLAGAAGVMLGFYNAQINHFTGFLPGLKAFTAAVLGGIGNIPGAMLGGLVLGMVESLGPTALDVPSEYKDVIAFSVLVLVLIFRPQGLLGEVIAGKRA